MFSISSVRGGLRPQRCKVNDDVFPIVQSPVQFVAGVSRCQPVDGKYRLAGPVNASDSASGFQIGCEVLIEREFGWFCGAEEIRMGISGTLEGGKVRLGSDLGGWRHTKPDRVFHRKRMSKQREAIRCC